MMAAAINVLMRNSLEFVVARRTSRLRSPALRATAILALRFRSGKPLAAPPGRSSLQGSGRNGGRPYRPRHVAIRYSPARMEPSQSALDQTLTIAFALASHVDDVLGKRTACGFSLAVEGSPAGLHALPSIVQRGAQNEDRFGVECFGVFPQIPDHFGTPSQGGSPTGLSVIGAWIVIGR